MAMAFVANSAPSGWKLGRWSQATPTTWQETKLDNSKLVYDFQLINGPSSFNGSTTVRLKMKDQNTEVLLLQASAQIFVNGSYFGEYGGSWERAGAGGSKQQAASRAPSTAAAAPAPAPAAQAQRPPSKQEEAASKRPSKQPEVEQGPAFEETLSPAQAQKAKPQKAAPPPNDSRKASGDPAPAPAALTMKTLPALPEMSTRPRKAAGLDTSDASMQKLIGAAKNGDVAKVTELLASGIDPDGPAKDGKTPLMEATRGGHVAVVEVLVEAFADPVLGKGEETPMTIAFQKGNQDLLKVLFKASFNSLDSSIKPGCMAAFPDSGNPRSDNQEVPEHAEQDLREVTKMIAGLNKERPISPAHQKYGNYAHMAGNVNDDAEKDSDMMREQSVRLAMKSLIKTANAEITGMDDFK